MSPLAGSFSYISFQFETFSNIQIVQNTFQKLKRHFSSYVCHFLAIVNIIFCNLNLNLFISY